MSAVQEPHGYLLEAESRHFSFRAFGRTEAAARDALAAVFARHGEQYGLPADWSAELDCNVTPVVFGAGYRDGALIVEPAP